MIKPNQKKNRRLQKKKKKEEEAENNASYVKLWLTGEKFVGQIVSSQTKKRQKSYFKFIFDLSFIS